MFTHSQAKGCNKNVIYCYITAMIRWRKILEGTTWTISPMPQNEATRMWIKLGWSESLIKHLWNFDIDSYKQAAYASFEYEQFHPGSKLSLPCCQLHRQVLSPTISPHMLLKPLRAWVMLLNSFPSPTPTTQVHEMRAFTVKCLVVLSNYSPTYITLFL